MEGVKSKKFCFFFRTATNTYVNLLHLTVALIIRLAKSKRNSKEIANRLAKTSLFCNYNTFFLKRNNRNTIMHPVTCLVLQALRHESLATFNN
jgi:hypothetical protein